MAKPKKAAKKTPENDFVRNVRLLRTDRVYEMTTVLGTRLAHKDRDFVAGSSAARFNPKTLLVSVHALCNTGEPRWDWSWIKKFGLTPISVRLYGSSGSGYSVESYISFADYLRVEASPEFKALRRERDAKRKEEEIRWQRQNEQYKAKERAYREAVEIVRNPATSDVEKAAAYRVIAAYQQSYIDAGIRRWSSHVEDALGLKSRSAKSAKTLAALVNAGKLSRIRATGWEYDTKSVQRYVLELAAQLE